MAKSPRIGDGSPIAPVRGMAHGNDRGFTLLEVLVAMGLALVAVAGVASLFALAMSATRDARDVSVETTLAAQKIEQLSSVAWGSSALALSPDDALDRDVPGYSDHVNAQGLVVESTPAASSSAVFVRRWTVRALQSDVGGAVVLRVRVITPRQVTGTLAASSLRLHNAEVLMATMRAPGSY